MLNVANKPRAREPHSVDRWGSRGVVLAFVVVCALGVLGCDSSPSPAPVPAGWPQFRGPLRDGVSHEGGLADQWPESGPRVVWQVPLGEGYSSVAVAEGFVYTMYGDSSDEWIVGLRASDGSEAWRFRSDAKMITQNGNGPRATPTVDGDLLFAVGARSRLYALDRVSGELIWSHDLEREFGGERPFWGTASSPLVIRDQVVVVVGGTEEGAFRSFEKRTGKPIWATGDVQPGYASPSLVTIDGREQLLFFAADSLIAVVPETGRELWRFAWETPRGVNAAQPLLIPPNRIFISSAYDMGAVVLEVSARGWRAPRVVWKNRGFKNLYSSTVLVDGNLFGFDNKIFKCIDAATGEERWKTRGFGHGSVVVADGDLIVLGDRGQLALVEPTPERFLEKSRAEGLGEKTWSPPAIAGGRLYLRNQAALISLDLGF